MNTILSKEALKLAKELLGGDGQPPARSIPETRAGDELFSYFLFKKRHGRPPGPDMLFNDFLYRMKVSDEALNPARTFISDKEFCKLYVSATVGDQHNVPTIAVLREPEQVDSFPFPQDCVVKPTHASGQIAFRTAGSLIDKGLIKSWFQLNFYRITREINYRYLTPKVIVEPLIFSGAPLNDFKLFCFNGKVEIIQVDSDRHTGIKRCIFDRNWNPQPWSMKYPKSTEAAARPKNLREMLSIAEKLARNFQFIRVDLYSDDQQCLVGELTNFPGNASNGFIPASSEAEASRRIFGDWG
jgi:hypothetical protein